MLEEQEDSIVRSIHKGQEGLKALGGLNKYETKEEARIERLRKHLIYKT